MKIQYYILCALYCGAIFWMSNRPMPDVPGVSFIGIDKVAHMGVFGGLAVLVAVGLRRSNDVVAPRIQYLVPIAAAIAYGATDELHQAFVSVRTADPYDFVADAIGAVIATVLLCRVLWHIPVGAVWAAECNSTPQDGIQ